MMAKPCRKDLLQWINVVSFAVDDVKLFLDTHPCDQNALAYFQEYSRMRNEALKEYAKYYGPLTIDTAAESCADRWDRIGPALFNESGADRGNWINEPWPWQEGGC